MGFGAAVVESPAPRDKSIWLEGASPMEFGRGLKRKCGKTRRIHSLTSIPISKAPRTQMLRPTHFSHKYLKLRERETTRTSSSPSHRERNHRCKASTNQLHPKGTRCRKCWNTVNRQSPNAFGQNEEGTEKERKERKGKRRKIIKKRKRKKQKKRKEKPTKDVNGNKNWVIQSTPEEVRQRNIKSSRTVGLGPGGELQGGRGFRAVDAPRRRGEIATRPMGVVQTYQ